MGLKTVMSTGEILSTLVTSIEDREPAGKPQDISSHDSIYTHFAAIDAITGGINVNTLTIIASPTGMGKTALALNFAKNISILEGTPVIYCTYDLQPKDLVQRILSSECMVEYQRYRAMKLSSDEFSRLDESAQMLSRAPLYFMEGAHEISLQDVAQYCTEVIKTCNSESGVLILDYLQLMPEIRHGQRDNLDPFLNQLREMAAVLPLSIVLICQSEPASETRTNYQPYFNDLPNCSAVQNYAHIVAVLHREEFWNSSTSSRGQAELIFFKNQNNPVGTVRLGFEPSFSRFVDLVL